MNLYGPSEGRKLGRAPRERALGPVTHRRRRPRSSHLSLNTQHSPLHKSFLPEDLVIFLLAVKEAGPVAAVQELFFVSLRFSFISLPIVPEGL